MNPEVGRCDPHFAANDAHTEGRRLEPSEINPFFRTRKQEMFMRAPFHDAASLSVTRTSLNLASVSRSRVS